jgi:hypothetical protein
MAQADDAKEAAKEGRAAKYEEKRRAKDEEREAAEREAEQELARLAAEKAKEEQAEFDKWKGMFSVDDGGTVEDQISAESQGYVILRRRGVVTRACSDCSSSQCA